MILRRLDYMSTWKNYKGYWSLLKSMNILVCHICLALPNDHPYWSKQWNLVMSRTSSGHNCQKEWHYKSIWSHSAPPCHTSWPSLNKASTYRSKGCIGVAYNATTTLYDCAEVMTFDFKVKAKMAHNLLSIKLATRQQRYLSHRLQTNIHLYARSLPRSWSTGS